MFAHHVILTCYPRDSASQLSILYLMVIELGFIQYEYMEFVDLLAGKEWGTGMNFIIRLCCTAGFFFGFSICPGYINNQGGIEWFI